MVIESVKFTLPRQTVPFPVKPFLQTQKKDPSLLEQSAFSSQGFLFLVHSSMSEIKRICLVAVIIVFFQMRLKTLFKEVL